MKSPSGTAYIRLFCVGTYYSVLKSTAIHPHFVNLQWAKLIVFDNCHPVRDRIAVEINRKRRGEVPERCRRMVPERCRRMVPELSRGMVPRSRVPAGRPEFLPEVSTSGIVNPFLNMKSPSGTAYIVYSLKDFISLSYRRNYSFEGGVSRA